MSGPELAELIAAAEDAADELNLYIGSSYPWRETSPAQRAGFNNEMTTVTRLRAAITKAKGDNHTNSAHVTDGSAT